MQNKQLQTANVLLVYACASEGKLKCSKCLMVVILLLLECPRYIQEARRCGVVPIPRHAPVEGGNTHVTTQHTHRNTTHTAHGRMVTQPNTHTDTHSNTLLFSLKNMSLNHFCFLSAVYLEIVKVEFKSFIVRYTKKHKD